MIRRLLLPAGALSAVLAGAAPAAAQQPSEPATPPATPPSGTPAAPPARAPLMPAQVTPPAPAPTGTSSPIPPATAPNPSPVPAPSTGDTSKGPGIAGEMSAAPRDVYGEGWWGDTHPAFELHGYFRTRAELFHNFALGRHNTPSDVQGLWPQPIDQSYVTEGGTARNVQLCGPADGYTTTNGVTTPFQNCFDKTQSSANVRFRVSPELHISDNLRVMSQIDALDNLVLGSTPDAYAMRPGSSTSVGASANGYSPAAVNGYAPLGFFSTTQGTPTAGVNGYRNSIDVKRVWAEYATPVGQLRFGRMPSHWGLGMLYNSGDGIDSDYQTTVDRIMFVSGIRSLDLYFGGAWDFVSTGPTSASLYDVYGGQPYNTCNLCNAHEWAAFVARRVNPEKQRLALARGDLVVNGGTYWVYRSQLLDVASGQTPYTFPGDDGTTANRGLERRGAWAIIPDLWVQLLWRKLRFEAEFASIIGDAEQLGSNLPNTPDVGVYKIRQYGLVTQTEYKALDDKLRLGFGFGWASGDPWVEGLSPNQSGLQTELNGGRGPISTFRFHPDYRIDLIFFRHILSRVEGAYYFRPSVDYDFLRNANGQKFGGGAALVWSRASEFEQTAGNKRDLGVELDVSLYYQAKDGSLNDDPSKVGGFYSMLQYGVFFPLGGLSYLSGQRDVAGAQNVDLALSTAQTLRLLLGVAY